MAQSRAAMAELGAEDPTSILPPGFDAAALFQASLTPYLSSTTVSRSDVRLIQYLDSSALGLVRSWLLIGYFLILYYPPLTSERTT